MSGVDARLDVAPCARQPRWDDAFATAFADLGLAGRGSGRVGSSPSIAARYRVATAVGRATAELSGRMRLRRRRSGPTCRSSATGSRFSGQPSRPSFRAERSSHDATRIPGSATRCWPPTSTSRSLSRRSTATSTSAGWSATSRWRGRAARSRSWSCSKADLVADLDERLAQVRARRRRRADRDRERAPRRSASTRFGHSCCRAGPRSSSARRASASPPSSMRSPVTRSRRSATVRDDDDSRPAHHDRPPAAHAARRLARDRHAGTPRDRVVRSRRADLGRTFADVDEIAAECRFSDCAPRARAGLRRPGGTRRRDARTAARFDSHRKLERELAHACPRDRSRRPAPPTGASGAQSSKSVNEHMQRKYGADR